MNKYHVFLVVLFIFALIISAIQPHDYFTWLLEVLPAVVGFVVLILTYKNFTFSNFTYFFIFLHMLILIVGGHYTYAEVPLFNWIKEVLHQSRNNYDKLGHFAQGFVPALIIREVFVRRKVINGKKWLFFNVVMICLGISALYELIEWFVSVNTGDKSDAFLGTQGYVWDTQSDMLMAFIGAVSALVFLSRGQDRSIVKVVKEKGIND